MFGVARSTAVSAVRPPGVSLLNGDAAKPTSGDPAGETPALRIAETAVLRFDLPAHETQREIKLKRHRSCVSLLCPSGR